MTYTLQFSKNGHEYTIDKRKRILEIAAAFVEVAIEMGELTITSKDGLTLLIVSKDQTT